MIVRDAEENDRNRWNEFVSASFPPVGAFFQSWEWGEFQQALGHETRRIVLADDNGDWQGLTLAVKHILPFGFFYYYLPRGPILRHSVWEDERRAEQALELIRGILIADSPKCVFVRMEPALEESPRVLTRRSFVRPPSYVQPRFNAVVGLEKPAEEILSDFSAAMRNNVRKAERKGVRVEVKAELTEAEWSEFRKMRMETASRAGKNIYPSEKYFREIVKILPSAIFAAHHGGTLAAINIVIFFSRTATYLFGAAYKDKLAVKTSPYLHWASMLEAKKRGFAFYDLGGIDSRLWPTLTYFKQQFGGDVITYMGNADAVLKPVFYRVYRFVHALLR